MIQRFALFVSIILTLCFSGCAGSPQRSQIAHPSQLDASITASEHLAQRAADEQAHDVEQSTNPIKLPPGINPADLIGSDSANERNLLTLNEALTREAQHFPLPGPATGDITPVEDEKLHQALRLYIRGRDAALQRDFQTAGNDLQQAAMLNPTSVPILRELARTYLAVNQAGRAIRLYEQILQLEPDESESLLTLSIAAQSQHQNQRAVALLARRILAGDQFIHDPLADIIAYDILWKSLRQLGYDYAAAEAVSLLLPELGPLASQSRYVPHITQLRHERGIILLQLGDTYCRINHYEDALQAYREAASYPLPQQISLAPRVVYANLHLNRQQTAQYEMLSALRSEYPRVRPELVTLCRYLAEQVSNIQLLRESVGELEPDPDNIQHLRLQSALNDRPKALQILRGILNEHPATGSPASDLFLLYDATQTSEAVDQLIELTQLHPGMAETYVGQFITSFPQPSAALRNIQLRDQSALLANLECRILIDLGALGRAWNRCASARSAWPDDQGLYQIAIQLAALLEEPTLLDDVVSDETVSMDANTLLTLARAYHQFEKNELALETVARAVQLQPNNAEILTALAQKHSADATNAQTEDEQLKSAELALHYAEQALAIDPTHEPVYQVLLGLLDRGRPMENEERYRQIAAQLTQTIPDTALARRLATQELIDHQQYASALEAALSYFAGDPSQTEFLGMAVNAWSRLNQPHIAEQWLEDQLVKYPGHPQLLEHWININHNLGEYQSVTQRLEDMAKADPPDFFARRWLESVYRAVDRPEDALLLAESRLLERPEGTHRAWSLATVYSQAGHIDQALEQLHWLAAQQSDDRNTADVRYILKWRDIAQTMIDAGKPCGAAEAFRIRLNGSQPLSPAAISLLATMTIAADAACGNQADATLSLLRDLDALGTLPILPGEETEPTLASTIYEASLIYTAVDEDDGAMQLMLAALELQQDNSQLLNNLGYASLEVGRHDDEVVGWIEQAYARSPEDTNIIDTLAWLRYHQGRFQRENPEAEPGALELLQQAVAAVEEPNPELLDHLGDTYWRVGQTEAALNTWRQAAMIMSEQQYRPTQTQQYRFLQIRVWGIIVKDPRELYDRQLGALQRRLNGKILAVDQGQEPLVTPIFAEVETTR